MQGWDVKKLSRGEVTERGGRGKDEESKEMRWDLMEEEEAEKAAEEERSE